MVKATIKEGDLIEILTDRETIKGILMPSGKEKIIIKLSAGYNIGIERKNIEKMNLIQGYKKREIKERKIEFKKDLPTISILLTGGTLSSKVDYRTGAVKARFNAEELLEMFPELNKIANIRSRLIRNMWSDDLRFKHFGLIAKEIVKEIKKNVDGVIIGIGTDNLAVASAALAFIFESCPIPIIFVGAQRSSDRGSSDAAMNLISAAEFIVKTDFSGVAICMHESMNDDNCLILPACKTAKLHSSRRDAFKAVNDKPIARINYATRQIEFIKKDYQKKDKKRKVIIKPKMEERVGLLKITVNMFPEQFEFFKGYKGLVIEGTGLGHTPGDVIDEFTKPHAKIMKAIKNLIEKGTIIVMTTQTLFGRVNMNVYSKGRDLINLGVIGNLTDVLPNIALVKLSWLLGNYKKEKVKELIGKNLRGEISERIDEFQPELF